MPTIAIYSSATGRVRRVVTDDRNVSPEQVAFIHAQPGEQWLPINGSQRHDAQPAVTAATGKSPQNDRYAIVRTSDGAVIGAVIADPGCGDRAPRNHELVAHDRASPGWRMLSGRTFARPVADLDAEIAANTAAKAALRGTRFDQANEATIRGQEDAIDALNAALIAERDAT